MPHLPSSATSRSGSTRSQSGSPRSPSSPAPVRSPGRAGGARRRGGGEAALGGAGLARAERASELVREFPELEGYIGAEYARLAGYPAAVTAAIEEQYLPGAGGGAAPPPGPRARAP